MIVVPSWTRLWTAQMAEEQLHAFKFKGTGLYISPNETLLVVPLDGDHDDPWRWFHGQHFHFHIFDAHISKTILAHCTNIPVREGVVSVLNTSVQAELSRPDSGLD